MGCVSSGQSSSSGSDDIPSTDNGGLPITTEKRFAVKNLDDQSRIVGEGEIEITATELVLHSATAASVRWPLRYLRRYGFDESLFSFESGRRCPTGEGIYAFSTRQAKTIFTLVEHNVRYGPKAGPGVDDNADGRGHNGTAGGSTQPTQDEPPRDQPVLPPDHPPKVHKQAINYIEVVIAGKDEGAVIAPPKLPVPAQSRTNYSEVNFPFNEPKSQGAAPMNYIQVNFDSSAQSNGRAGGGSEPPPKPRTTYQDVIVGDSRRPSMGGDPTKYDRIDFDKTNDILKAKTDA